MFSLQLDPGQYRARRFLDFCRAVVIPCAALSVIVRVFDLPLGIFSIPAHVLFAVLWKISSISYHRVSQNLEAKQMDARMIPHVVGKWPGNIDILLRMMKAFKTAYILDVYLDLFEEYQCTTLNTRILWVDQIITMDQEHAKFVLATGFSNFWRGRVQKERLETFLGQGIFNRDDEQWKFHRTNARPFFARERISDFAIFERYTNNTISILSRLSGQACDAQDLYSRFTLDAASEFLFGHNLDTLSGSLPIPGKTAMGPKGSATDDSWGTFAKAFESAQIVATTRARLGYFWPLVEAVTGGDRMHKHSKEIREWLDPIVRKAVDDKKRVESKMEDRTFLEHLAGSTDDYALIRDQLLSMLLASRDTTACLLTFVTYFMAVYPDVARKLRAEVLEHCGERGAPTYESLRNLKYMRAVINETLRLFPPVPLNIRESRASAVRLPLSDASCGSSAGSKPMYMPANTPLVYLPLLTQRNPVLWGPDADIFDPERWIDSERVKMFTKNPAMYAPFSAGPRICIGQNYAYNEASYFLVRLLQRFDTFTLAPEYQPEGSAPPDVWQTRKGRQAYERIWPAAALTLYVKGGMWVRFGRSKS